MSDLTKLLDESKDKIKQVNEGAKLVNSDNYDEEFSDKLENALHEQSYINEMDKISAKVHENAQSSDRYFRNIIGEKYLKSIEEDAPKYMIEAMKNNDSNAIITLGEDVMAQTNTVLNSIIENNKDIQLSPELQSLFTEVYVELENINPERYKKNKKNNDKFNNTFDKFMGFFKERKNDIKVKRFDSKSVLDKFSHLEIALLQEDANISRTVEGIKKILEMTEKNILQIAVVNAFLEEMIDAGIKYQADMEKALQQSEDNKLNYVLWNNEKIEISRYKADLAKASMVLTFANEQWFTWRQQYFIFFGAHYQSQNQLITTTKVRLAYDKTKKNGLTNAKLSVANAQHAISTIQSSKVIESLGTFNKDVSKLSNDITTQAIESSQRAVSSINLDENDIKILADSVIKQQQLLEISFQSNNAVMERLNELMHEEENRISRGEREMNEKLINSSHDIRKFRNVSPISSTNTATPSTSKSVISDILNK